MNQLHLISGGAAQGLVGQLEERFATQHGCAIEGTFGAVGMMHDKLLGGPPCDVVILTEALIGQLEAQGHVVSGSARAVGLVKTGVAVRQGEPWPEVGTPQALAAVLRGAQGVYFPDPVKSTAGIHFMKVLKSLGLDVELASRLRPFPNGATAMRALSQASGPSLVGCTQVTEILHTPGVQLVGVLPKALELATVYTAAVCARSAQPEAATALVTLLASAEARPLREAGGFEPAA